MLQNESGTLYQWGAGVSPVAGAGLTAGAQAARTVPAVAIAETRKKSRLLMPRFCCILLLLV